MSSQIPYIVILEDDHFQASDIYESLKQELGKAELEKISCEAEFLDRFESKPDRIPDLFVLDLMVEWQKRWIKTQRPFDSNLPTDRAGIRCLQAVRKYDRDVPVIVCTVVDTNTLEKVFFDERKTFLRRKEETDESLIDLAKKLLASS